MVLAQCAQAIWRRRGSAPTLISGFNSCSIMSKSWLTRCRTRARLRWRLRRRRLSHGTTVDHRTALARRLVQLGIDQPAVAGAVEALLHELALPRSFKRGLSPGDRPPENGWARYRDPNETRGRRRKTGRPIPVPPPIPSPRAPEARGRALAGDSISEVVAGLEDAWARHSEREQLIFLRHKLGSIERAAASRTLIFTSVMKSSSTERGLRLRSSSS
jgi:hypothetical protein